MGADLAGRRPDAHRLPPPHPPLPCGGPRGSRLSVLHLSADGLCAARRNHPLQRHARHDADGDARILDGRALCGPRLHDERGQGARALLLQRAPAASPGGRLPAAQWTLDAAPGESRLPARGSRARPRLHQRPLAGPHRLRAACRRPLRMARRSSREGRRAFLHLGCEHAASPTRSHLPQMRRKIGGNRLHPAPCPACERQQPALQHCERIVSGGGALRAGSIFRRVLLAIAAVILRDPGVRARSGFARGRCRYRRSRRRRPAFRQPGRQAAGLHRARCERHRSPHRGALGESGGRRPTGSSSRSPILRTSRSTGCSSCRTTASSAPG